MRNVEYQSMRLLTAEEARNITSKEMLTMTQINKDIREKCEIGRFACIYNTRYVKMSEDTRDMLERLGYTVREHSGHILMVSWNDESTIKGSSSAIDI